MRWVVTGTNRGIGLELTRQLAARGDTVVATVRDVARAGAVREVAEGASGRVTVHACDVRDDASVRAFAAELGATPVDVLVNNAGVMGRLTSLEDLDMDDAKDTFDTNALGPLRVARALLPHLARGARRCIVHVSSGMGSISVNTSGGAYAYRMAKAALNMANKSMSVDLAGRGFVCVVMCPGWVDTDMGGRGAPLPVDVSVRHLLTRIDGFSAHDNGAFVSHDGRAIPY